MGSVIGITRFYFVTKGSRDPRQGLISTYFPRLSTKDLPTVHPSSTMKYTQAYVYNPDRRTRDVIEVLEVLFLPDGCQMVVTYILAICLLIIRQTNMVRALRVGVDQKLTV